MPGDQITSNLLQLQFLTRPLPLPGYRPEAVSGGQALYPNEVASDFAFIPFGGGARKCVGDQFALMEATVSMAMLVRRFTFELAVPPEKVRMRPAQGAGCVCRGQQLIVWGWICLVWAGCKRTVRVGCKQVVSSAASEGA